MIWQLAQIAANGFLTGMLFGLAAFLLFGGAWLFYINWKERHEA